MALGLAETAKLAVDLSLKGNFTSQLAASQRSLTGFNRAITNTQGRAYKAGQQIGTGIKSGAIIAAAGIGLLITQIGAGLRQLATLEDAQAATVAALKSTKGASGQTADSIRHLAESFESLNATIDDKVIQSGENVLLTFTNIRKKAFEPALKAALDLSVGMKQDLQTSIVQIGKALNDPIKGLTSLSRIGVAFSESQRKQIKALVESNDLFGAQKIILAELSKEFGGRFAAGGKTATGVIAGIGDAVEDLQKALATALFPTIQKLLPKLRGALADPKVVATIRQLGDSIASLFSDKNLAEGGRILGSLFDTAKAAAPILKDAGVAMLNIVKTAVGLFQSLPKEVQQLAIGAFAINKLTGGLVTNVAGGIVGAILGKLRSAVVNVTGAVVNVNGVPGIGGLPTGGGGGGIVGAIKAGAKIVFPIAVGLALAEGLTAVFEAALPPSATPEEIAARHANLPRSLRGSASFRDQGGFGRSGPGVTAGGFNANQGSSITAGGFDRRVGAPSQGVFNIIGRTITDAIKTGFRTRDREFAAAVAALKTASKPAEVRKAVAAALAVVIGQRRGNALATGRVLADLKGQLVHTTDPETRKILEDAIAKVEHKLAGRALVQKQLDKADKIAKSTESTKDKIKDLTAIQKGLAHTSKSGQDKIQAKIDALKTEEKKTTQAVKNKDLSVSLTSSNVVNVGFDIRTVIGGASTIRKYGNSTTNISTKSTNILVPS